jgi:hypothetical protein
MVVALMIGIFLTAGAVHNHWFSVHLLLAPMFVLIGIALIVLDGRSSSKVVSGGPKQPGIAVFLAPVSLIGLGFLSGGLLYGLTANAHAIVYSFAMSVVVMVVVSLVVGQRRRA